MEAFYIEEEVVLIYIFKRLLYVDGRGKKKKRERVEKE